MSDAPLCMGRRPALAGSHRSLHRKFASRMQLLPEQPLCSVRWHYGLELSLLTAPLSLEAQPRARAASFRRLLLSGADDDSSMLLSLQQDRRSASLSHSLRPANEATAPW